MNIYLDAIAILIFILCFAGLSLCLYRIVLYRYPKNNHAPLKSFTCSKSKGIPIYDIFAMIHSELERAKTKFPQWPTDPLHAFAIVAEEFGETQKEVLQLVYEPHKTSPEQLRKEAVQLAAMSLRFLQSLDQYEFKPSEQHDQ